ncbi:hypothetical protein GmHk_16G046927 [Glycine max]|nr:hypothetical protein GmHk_16G046927 [Glycine max]
MVNAILANATDTLNYIKKHIKITPDLELEHKLALCADSYSPVVMYILPQAADAISQGQFGFDNLGIFYVKKKGSKCLRQEILWLNSITHR